MESDIGNSYGIGLENFFKDGSKKSQNELVKYFLFFKICFIKLVFLIYIKN